MGTRVDLERVWTGLKRQLSRYPKKKPLDTMRPYFDEAFYLESYPEVRNVGMAPLEHFAVTGWKEGKDPAPWFSVTGYIERYSDVRSSGGNPFLHYLLYGQAEGRAPRPQDGLRNVRGPRAFTESQVALIRSEFEPEYYLEQYPDVRATGQDPLQHYLECGWLEGRNPNSRFDVAAYLDRNPDVRAAGINPFVHFIQHVEPMRAYFDEAFYCESYPDVRDSAMTPFEHFASIGWKEGKNPAPWFSVRGYLERYGDVRSSGVNPFIHYVLYGKAEGRAPRPQDGFRGGPGMRAFSESEIELIRSEFDPEYYLEQYPDVRAAGFDPLQHYLENGWLEGRNPNSRFDAASYLDRNPDVRAASINPFLHYLQHGKAEGRSPVRDRFQERTASFTALLTAPTNMPSRHQLEASVIVPIYDAFEDVRDLLANLEQTLDSTTPVILIDDCSPDERIAPLLAEVTARHDSWTSVRNERNAGFSVSVNRGIELAAEHVVIVNSDVLLPQDWLARLMEPILANHDSIASVTPFSNNSHLTGFPNVRQEEDLYLDAKLDEIDRSFASLPPLDIDIATGVGFCMALNRRVLDAIGGFDAEIYHRGYFEDTDWCQRAVLAGYRNVAATNLFVYHKLGSGSYGMALRNQYSDRNRAEFVKRFPSYPENEQYFLQRDPLLEVRAAARAILWRDRARGGVLILDHSWGGGANQFSERLRQRFLAEDNVVINLALYGDQITCSVSYGDEIVTIKDRLRTDVLKLVDRFGVTEVIVNGIHGAVDVSLTLADLAQLNARLIFYVHDYMSVCPSLFLLDHKDRYCGVPRPFECQSCIFVNKNVKFPFSNIVEWRREWRRFLEKAAEVRVFSESSRAILLKAYPWLGTRICIEDPAYAPPVRPVAVQPQRLDSANGDKPIAFRQKPSLHVGIMGVLNLHKGTRVVSGLAYHVYERQLSAKLSLFGEWHGEVKPINLNVIGPYRPEQISDVMEEHGIDVVLFPSICPETYSYTLSEIFGMQLPVVALGIGAQEERVQRYSWGILVKDPTPEALYAALSQAHLLRCGEVGEVA